jgi:hypothetical protein
MEGFKVSDIEKLKTQKKQIDARIKAAEAREKTKTRKSDTRKKIIIGSLFMKINQEKQPAAMQVMREIVNRMSERDKKLFNIETAKSGE